MRSHKPGFILLCLIGLIVASQPLSNAQSLCESKIEEWRNAFGLLQEAIGETQRLKDSPVTQSIRERVSSRQPAETMADAIRSVLEEKTKRVAESQERCHDLAEQEKLAFQTMNRCVTAIANRRDPSVNQRVREIAKDREKAMRDLRYVMTDEAYIQYLNQRPLTQDDYSDNQKLSGTNWYSFKASR